MTVGSVLSPRAQADLEEIWNYSAERWGVDCTERNIRELWDGIAYVASDPRRGRSCDEIRVGYYKYTVASHVLFFRTVSDGIDIVRILHGNMDFDRHL
jgi:toxin ParE1/3/4